MITTTYSYQYNSYESEADAHDAVAALKIRLDNNPTDWMEAKEITGSPETGWLVASTKLTDSQLLSPNPSKTYLCYSQYDGQTRMPLTASELVAKRNILRTAYADYCDVTKIFKVVVDETTDPPTMTGEIITPTTDMSSYVTAPGEV